VIRTIKEKAAAGAGPVQYWNVSPEWTLWME